MICWDHRLSVHVPSIDDDHRALIRIINDLHLAIEGPCARAILGRLLSRLADYAGEHFRREEQVMRHFAYPDLATHMALHEALLNRLAVIVHEYEIDDASVTPHTIDLVQDWITVHVASEDCAFGTFLKRRLGDPNHLADALPSASPELRGARVAA